MPTIKVPQSVQFGINEANQDNSQLLLNMYAVQSVAGENEAYSMRQRYGLREIADTGEEIRGIGVFNNTIYAVGETLIRRYQLNGSPLATTAFATSAGQRYELQNNSVFQIAFLANDGTYAVLDGGTMYTPSFPAGFTSTNYTFMDGYFIFDRSGSQQFFISNILDGRTFSALDFASASEKSDNIRRIISANNQLWLLGDNTIEVFQNTGNNLFPFEQSVGATDTSIGCAAEYSAAVAQNSLIFLGSDGAVYRSEGYNIVKISTPQIDEIVSRVDILNDARAYTFPEAGYWWYVITFIDEDITFCCNLTTLEWHRRKTFGQNTWALDFITPVTTKTYGAIGNKIYVLEKEATDDADVTMEREWTTAVIEDSGKNIIHHEIQPQITTGTVSALDDQDTVVEISYSDDGGFNYSTPRSVSLQANRQYGKKVAARGLGVAKRRIYKFKVTDKLEVSSIGCRARIEIEERE